MMYPLKFKPILKSTLWGGERIIPFNSPYIHAIEVNKKGVVRRSRIFYFRELTGKKAKIKEKKF